MRVNFKQVAALSCLSLAALAGCKSSSEESAAPKAAEYKMQTIATSDCQVSQSFSASIRGEQDIEITPQVAGKLTKVNIEEGERVAKNQVLFVVDQVPYIAALERAKAAVVVAESQLATASLTFDSKSELFKAGVISQYEYKTAENALLTAEANLANAKAEKISAANDLSYTEVKSPSAGITGTIPYRVGTYVSAMMLTPLTTVSNNSTMYVYFSLAENDLLALLRKYGSKSEAIKNFPELSLTLGDGSLYEHKGKLSTISGVIDPSTGAVSLRAEFPNENELLHSGASGNVVLTTPRDSVIIIPQAATYELQNKSFVFKVVDGKASSTAVEITKVNGGKQYIVESGLAVGDVIISEGAGLVREGTAVVAASEKSQATPQVVNKADNQSEKE